MEPDQIALGTYRDYPRYGDRKRALVEQVTPIMTRRLDVAPTPPITDGTNASGTCGSIHRWYWSEMSTEGNSALFGRSGHFDQGARAVLFTRQKAAKFGHDGSSFHLVNGP